MERTQRGFEKVAFDAKKPLSVKVLEKHIETLRRISKKRSRREPAPQPSSPQVGPGPKGAEIRKRTPMLRRIRQVGQEFLLEI
jgi:hypothetical protein